MARQTLFMRTSKRYSPAHSRRFVALSRQQHRKAVSARQRPRIKGASMGRTLTVRTVLVLGGLALLTACGGNGPMGFKNPFSGGGSKSGKSTTLVERDVEAPEVFQTTDKGLWDGRPSLGGIWVAHPDVVDPERAIVRNEDNGKFVIGALFRRESDNPGPAIQVSSEAAEALGMLAGKPATLNVTALRKVEAPAEPETDPVLEAPEEIAATPAGRWRHHPRRGNDRCNATSGGCRSSGTPACPCAGCDCGVLNTYKAVYPGCPVPRRIQRQQHGCRLAQCWSYPGCAAQCEQRKDDVAGSGRTCTDV